MDHEVNEMILFIRGMRVPNAALFCYFGLAILRSFHPYTKIRTGFIYC